jgi:predicted site-specific integrase-resolvase
VSDDRLLRPDQVARALGVAVSTLRQWRRSGTGPPAFALPAGRSRRWRYPASGVERYIARGRIIGAVELLDAEWRAATEDPQTLDAT